MFPSCSFAFQITIAKIIAPINSTNLKMHAAVVNAWGQPPQYQSFSLPDPAPNQVRIKIIAAGLHGLVRSRAAGKHYSTMNTPPPHIPGTDGVGRVVATGELVYFTSFANATG